MEFNGITTSCALHTPRNDRETSSRIYFGILPIEKRNDGKILKQVQDDKDIPSPLEEQREPTRYELCDPVSET